MFFIFIILQVGEMLVGCKWVWASLFGSDRKYVTTCWVSMVFLVKWGFYRGEQKVKNAKIMEYVASFLGL